MGGITKRHGLLRIGPIWPPKACLATWGRSTPFSHAYRGNRPISQKTRVSPKTQVGLCVDGPYRTTAHLQNTTSTPPASCWWPPIRAVAEHWGRGLSSKFFILNTRARTHAHTHRPTTTKAAAPATRHDAHMVVFTGALTATTSEIFELRTSLFTAVGSHSFRLVAVARRGMAVARRGMAVARRETPWGAESDPNLLS